MSQTGVDMFRITSITTPTRNTLGLSSSQQAQAWASSTMTRSWGQAVPHLAHSIRTPFHRSEILQFPHSRTKEYEQDLQPIPIWRQLQVLQRRCHTRQIPGSSRRTCRPGIVILVVVPETSTVPVSSGIIDSASPVPQFQTPHMPGQRFIVHDRLHGARVQGRDRPVDLRAMAMERQRIAGVRCDLTTHEREVQTRLYANQGIRGRGGPSPPVSGALRGDAGTEQQYKTICRQIAERRQWRKRLSSIGEVKPGGQLLSAVLALAYGRSLQCARSYTLSNASILESSGSNAVGRCLYERCGSSDSVYVRSGIFQLVSLCQSQRADCIYRCKFELLRWGQGQTLSGFWNVFWSGHLLVELVLPIHHLPGSA